MCPKAMTFSDKGWRKLNERAVEFHNEQWVGAIPSSREQPLHNTVNTVNV